MAVRAKIGVTGSPLIESKPKKTRQGQGKHSKFSPTSSNNRKKRLRGQGRG